MVPDLPSVPSTVVFVPFLINVSDLLSGFPGSKHYSVGFGCVGVLGVELGHHWSVLIEFRSGGPGGFDTWEVFPFDKVLHASAVPFRIKDIFGFRVGGGDCGCLDLDLVLIWELGMGYRFQEDLVKEWMDRSPLLGKLEFVRASADLLEDLERAVAFVFKLLVGTVHCDVE